MSEPQADQTDQEPTMEEILSSIRRIISDDDQEQLPDGGAVQAKSDELSNQASEGEDSSSDSQNPNDILDLTEMVLEDGSTVRLGKDGQPAKTDSAGADLSAQGDPILKSKLDALGLMARSSGGSLLDTMTADTAAAAFAQLASTRAERATTLEELVRELLRPMLKSWLDENLSQVVGRLVEREITKLSGNVDDT